MDQQLYSYYSLVCPQVAGGIDPSLEHVYILPKYQDFMYAANHNHD